MGVNTGHCFKLEKYHTPNNEMKQISVLLRKQQRSIRFVFLLDKTFHMKERIGRVHEAFIFTAIQSVSLDQV